MAGLLGVRAKPFKNAQMTRAALTLQGAVSKARKEKIAALNVGIEQLEEWGQMLSQLTQDNHTFEDMQPKGPTK